MTMMPKKASVLLCGPPLSAVGGGPAHMRNMLSSPLRDKYRLVHFETGSRGTESPAQDESPKAKAVRIVTSPFALGWAIMKSKPKVVHLNSVFDRKALFRDTAYLLVSKLLGRGVVFQFHGGSLDALSRNRWMQRMVRAIYSMPDALVLLATSEKRGLEALGVRNRAVIIPNAVDVSRYRGAKNSSHSGRLKRVIYMGRLVREKGIFEAIEAIEILRQRAQFREIELRIAGSGPARDDLEKDIADRGLGHCVALVGPVDGMAKVEFLRDADAFIFPSYHPEGLPYSILESLAAGIPVVASKMGGIPDILVDRVHGILLSNARDPAEIASAVEELGQSRDVLCAMSRNCMEWAATHLGLARLGMQFSELYESLDS